MENLIIDYLLQNNYASDYNSAIKIHESLSDLFLNYIINEAIDPKYNEVIRTLHRHTSSDSDNPRNRVNLAKYLEKRRRVVRPGGEYYDSGKKSQRPIFQSRKRLTPTERQKRRDEDENVDTRFSTKKPGSYGITKNPKKLRKQKAMDEFN
jgi:hypothetical protein